MKINLPPSSIDTCLDKVLLILSCLQPPDRQLTPVEIMILREFMLLPPRFEHFRFASLAKAEVLKALASKGFKISRSNLNNRIYDLQSKGYIRRDLDKVMYLSKYLETLRTTLSSSKLELTLIFNGIQSTPDTSKDFPDTLASSKLSWLYCPLPVWVCEREHAESYYSCYYTLGAFRENKASSLYYQ